jgi:acetolactate synthase regulatory subunit
MQIETTPTNTHFEVEEERAATTSDTTATSTANDPEWAIFFCYVRFDVEDRSSSVLVVVLRVVRHRCVFAVLALTVTTQTHEKREMTYAKNERQLIPVIAKLVVVASVTVTTFNSKNGRQQTTIQRRRTRTKFYSDKVPLRPPRSAHCDAALPHLALTS